MSEVDKIFDLFDKDKSDSLDRKEVEKLLLKVAGVMKKKGIDF